MTPRRSRDLDISHEPEEAEELAVEAEETVEAVVMTQPARITLANCSFCNAPVTPDPKGLHECMCRRKRIVQ